jgi:hypothetical protein
VPKSSTYDKLIMLGTEIAYLIISQISETTHPNILVKKHHFVKCNYGIQTPRSVRG